MAVDGNFIMIVARIKISHGRISAVMRLVCKKWLWKCGCKAVFSVYTLQIALFAVHTIDRMMNDWEVAHTEELNVFIVQSYSHPIYGYIIYKHLASPNVITTSV